MDELSVMYYKNTSSFYYDIFDLKKFIFKIIRNNYSNNK